VLTSLRLRQFPSLLSAASNKHPLRKGDSGTGVAAIQELLRDLGYKFPISFAHGRADGIFGNETKLNVELFQQKESLQVDGIIGKDTLGRLDQMIVEHDILEQHSEIDCDRRNAINRTLPEHQKTCTAN
jgi:peptidoglycan hydrolase-like protein with peptidoglycan-binding domain